MSHVSIFILGYIIGFGVAALVWVVASGKIKL